MLHDPTDSGDHAAIQFALNLEASRKYNAVREKNFKKANIDEILNYLSNVLDHSIAWTQ